MDLGSNIKKYRKKAGLTQRELAEILDVATGTIQQYELGKRQPRLEMINRIAGVLGIGIRKLYPDFQYEEWKKTETYKDTHLKNTIDPLRPELLSHFQMLNSTGKKEAVKRVEELTEIPRYTQPDMQSDFPMLNAAHADNYADAPEELKQQEENIMDDENF